MVIVASGAGIHALWGGNKDGVDSGAEGGVEGEVEGGTEGVDTVDGMVEGREETDHSLPFSYVRGQNIHFTQSNPQSNSQLNSQSNFIANSQSNLRSMSPFPSPLLSGEYLIPRRSPTSDSGGNILTLVGGDSPVRSPTSDSGGNILTLVGGGTHEHLSSWKDLEGWRIS